jgi:hypothetical protein
VNRAKQNRLTLKVQESSIGAGSAVHENLAIISGVSSEITIILR